MTSSLGFSRDTILDVEPLLSDERSCKLSLTSITHLSEAVQAALHDMAATTVPAAPRKQGGRSDARRRRDELGLKLSHLRTRIWAQPEPELLRIRVARVGFCRLRSPP